MKIIHYTEAEPTQFDTDIARGVTGRVLIGKADGASNFCMRLFELSEGGYTPRHVHEWEHEIFCHSGKGEVLCDGKWTPIANEYACFIPGNAEHQIKNTGEKPLIFACLIPSSAPEM